MAWAQGNFPFPSCNRLSLPEILLDSPEPAGDQAAIEEDDGRRVATTVSIKGSRVVG